LVVTAVTAWLDEAHARFNENAGISLGNWGRRLTWRAMLGTSADGRPAEDHLVHFLRIEVGTLQEPRAA
jgi:hypothetical protein